MLVERGRCLWCLDEVIRELETKVGGKLLSEAQLHAAQVKLQIARAVCVELRRAVISGVRPPGGPGRSGAADLSSEPA
jgi:hypothetical protein